VRRGRKYEYKLTYVNSGDADAPTRFMQVTAPEAALWSTDGVTKQVARWPS
jgi:hypothetical protein